MTSPSGASPGFEPSVEAVAMLRDRLQQLGFLIRIDSAHEVLRAVLAIEAARLDLRAHDAAAECLRSIQTAAREALDILTQGVPGTEALALAGTHGNVESVVTRPAAAPARPASEPQAPAARRPSPAPTAPAEEQPVSLAEVVRRHLGEAMPADARPVRPDTQTSPPPLVIRPTPAEPRRPVIKHPRKR
jgi:hypothetical protein